MYKLLYKTISIFVYVYICILAS